MKSKSFTDKELVNKLKRDSRKNKASAVRWAKLLEPTKRYRTDNYIARQVEIKRILDKQFKHITMEYYRFSHWFDFASPRHKTVISIVGRSGINQKMVDIVKKAGWQLLFVNYEDPDQSSMGALLETLIKTYNKEIFIEKRAQELNRDLPKSEQWFQTKIKSEPFYNQLDLKYNVPLFGLFIPDAYSEYLRLCIEVDGSVHNEWDQIVKDNNKNEVTRRKGFNIIRVIAFDEESYKSCILNIERLLNERCELKHHQFMAAELKKVDFKKKMPF